MRNSNELIISWINHIIFFQKPDFRHKHEQMEGMT